MPKGDLFHSEAPEHWRVHRPTAVPYNGRPRMAILALVLWPCISPILNKIILKITRGSVVNHVINSA